MSLKRGGFFLKCDHGDCDTEIDLETDDFEEAKEFAQDHKTDNDWATVQRGGRYVDLCGRH